MNVINVNTTKSHKSNDTWQTLPLWDPEFWSKVRDTSLHPNGLSSLPLEVRIRIVTSGLYLGGITKQEKIRMNDTPIGAKSTDLNIASAAFQGSGLVSSYGSNRWHENTVTIYPDNNPKTQFGVKKIPLDVVPPSAIHAMARAFADGAKKYGPFNWREKNISSTVYYGAALRHLMAWYDGENTASDSNLSHLDHALACIAMIVDGQSVGKLNDNRPPKGAAAQMQKEWNNEST